MSIPFDKINMQDIKNIIKKIDGKTPKHYTHIIEYIFTQNELEHGTYRDIYHLLYSNKKNINCIFDIMLITLSEAHYLHMEKGNYSMKSFDKKTFFSKESFVNFVKLAKKTQEKLKNVNTVFTFCGHCDGWYCYCDDSVLDFNMMRDIFIEYNMNFDLICFDSCYTSSIEIIYQFHDLTKYLIAHQTYIGIEGFNSQNTCKIFDSSLHFRDKLLITTVDFLKRSKKEKEHASNTLIDCEMIKNFFTFVKTNFKEIKKLINNKKSKKYITDPCGEWMNYCNIKDEKKSSCNTNYCDNSLDLYQIIKNSNIPNKDEALKIFKLSVSYITNGISLNPKYYNKNMNFHGINVVINPKKSDMGKHYEKLKFYNDFF
jgi:hypothetical protein